MTASSLHKVLTKTKLKKDFKSGGTINESYHITFSRDGDFFLTQVMNSTEKYSFDTLMCMCECACVCVCMFKGISLYLSSLKVSSA